MSLPVLQASHPINENYRINEPPGGLKTIFFVLYTLSPCKILRIVCIEEQNSNEIDSVLVIFLGILYSIFD